MKRIFIFLLVLLLILPSLFACKKAEDSSAFRETTSEIIPINSEITPINMDKKTFNFSDDNIQEKLKLQGRYSFTNQGLTFDMVCETLEFNAYCLDDVKINLTIQSLVEDYWNCYFTVFVDDVQQERIEVESSSLEPETKDMTIATGLSEGNHSFKIIRQTESSSALVVFRRLSISGELTEKPQNSDLYIEFYGDSITVGMGNLILHNDGNESFYPVNQDATLSYPYLTAQAVNADVSIIARTGIGVKKGWDDANPDMISVYPYTNFYRNKTDMWGFERKADIISINLGTNDCWLGLSEEDLQSAMVEFMTIARQDNPDAKIVWVVGGMEHLYEMQAANAVAECGGEEKGFYVFKMSIAEKEGGKMHPYYTEYPKLAEELTNFFKSIIGE